MSKPKIRHLAIKSPNPQRLAEFYQDAFGMEVLLHEEGGAYYLTDGYITLALLQSRPENAPPGLNHFGFAVDDADAVSDKLQEHGLPAPKVRPSNRPYAELRGMDPDGNLYDISVHGFENEEYLPERTARQGREKEKVS
jgi:catechol 2,3-dioxygenase-like lactoylglutathione lyase family enzyme